MVSFLWTSSLFEFQIGKDVSQADGPLYQAMTFHVVSLPTNDTGGRQACLTNSRHPVDKAPPHLFR
jgi:hypothetical protein